MNSVISFTISITILGLVYLLCLINGIPFLIFLFLTFIPILLILFNRKLKLKLKEIFVKVFDKNKLSSTKALIICLSVLIVSIAFTKNSYRWGGWDAWAIWNLHAEFLIYGNSWENLFSNKIAWTHPDYPLMLSSLIGMLWKSVGYAVPVIPSVDAYVVLLCIPFSVYGALKLKGLEILGVLFFILLAMDFHFISRAASQYSDTLLSLFILLTIILFSIYKETNYNLVYILGFISGTSGWIKNEGILFFLVFSFYFIKDIKKMHRKVIGRYLIGAIIPLISIIAFKIFYAPPNDLIQGQSSIAINKLFEIDRYFITMRFLIYTLLSKYIILDILIVTLIVLKFTKHKVYLSTSFKILFTLLSGYIAIYILTPHDLNWHLTSDTAFRSRIIPLTT